MCEMTVPRRGETDQFVQGWRAAANIEYLPNNYLLGLLVVVLGVARAAPAVRGEHDVFRRRRKRSNGNRYAAASRHQRESVGNCCRSRLLDAGQLYPAISTLGGCDANRVSPGLKPRCPGLHLGCRIVPSAGSGWVGWRRKTSGGSIVNKRLSSIVAGVVLLAISGVAQGQCENLRVIVRNSVYAVQGLDIFCTEFNKMKADIAGMRSELVIARETNALMKARLAAVSGQEPPQPRALVARDASGDHSAP